MIKKHNVVQFNENHKWVGCLGIVKKADRCGSDTRYMVSVQIPQNCMDHIYVMESEKAIEYIGEAILVEKDDDDERTKTTKKG